MIVAREIGDEAAGDCDVVSDMTHLLESKLGSRSTGPVLNALLRAVCESRKNGVVLGLGCVVREGFKRA